MEKEEIMKSIRIAVLAFALIMAGITIFVSIFYPQSQIENITWIQGTHSWRTIVSPSECNTPYKWWMNETDTLYEAIFLNDTENWIWIADYDNEIIYYIYYPNGTYTGRMINITKEVII